MTVKAFCSNCKKITTHGVVKEVKESVSDEGDGYYASYQYQIIKCNGCENISFREVSSNSWGRYNEDGSPIESVKQYPLTGEEILPLKGYYSTPHKIRVIYRETMDAFNNGMYILCSAGLRAIIESICNNEGINDGPIQSTRNGGTIIQRKKNLQGKISGLQEKGLLTKKHSEFLHEHRFLGNEALHTLDQPSVNELKIAIEITEHTIENLYEISDKADKLRRTRAFRKKGGL